MSLGLPLKPRDPWLVPEGARPPHRGDGPPDGWIMVSPSRWVGLRASVDRFAIWAADAAAGGMSRRRFLRRVGEFGLFLGVTATGVLWGVNEAQAWTICNAYGFGDPGPCGPSPICGDPDCTNTAGCDTSHSCNGINTKWRKHALGECGTENDDNSWNECCPRNDPNQMLHKCTDCCSCQTQTNICSDSTCAGSVSHWKCICRKPLNQPCNI